MERLVTPPPPTLKTRRPSLCGKSNHPTLRTAKSHAVVRFEKHQATPWHCARPRCRPRCERSDHPFAFHKNTLPPALRRLGHPRSLGTNPRCRPHSLEFNSLPRTANNEAVARLPNGQITPSYYARPRFHVVFHVAKRRVTPSISTKLCRRLISETSISAPALHKATWSPMMLTVKIVPSHCKKPCRRPICESLCHTQISRKKVTMSPMMRNV